VIDHSGSFGHFAPATRGPKVAGTLRVPSASSRLGFVWQNSYVSSERAFQAGGRHWDSACYFESRVRLAQEQFATY